MGKKVAGIGNKAVESKTGKTWDEWLTALDEENGTDMNHKEIAILLKDKFGLSSWWSQQVTVGYEQERGMREIHERKDGFEASKSKTIDVPIEKLFEAWSREELRKKWLDYFDYTVRKATKNQSIRINWPDDTNLVVNFYPVSDVKSRVTVQHGKLTDQAAVHEKKKYWSKQLKQLKNILEEN